MSSKNEIKKIKKIEKIEKIECNICCESYLPNKGFNCHNCNNEYCLSCFKNYLLNSTQDPHCMHCKNTIDYDIFLEITEKSWRQKIYKPYREKILWDRQQSMMPLTVGKINLENQVKKIIEKRDELYKEINKLNEEIQELSGIKNKKNTIKFNWTHACPNGECRGFLNENYECPVCENKFCKDCLEVIHEDENTNEMKYLNDNENENNGHKCNKELVETLKIIRQDSKSCPDCGTYISKISGCDQMFCVSCGCAFSWNTGLKETGLIHNPHAHAFFQQNPEALNNYTNNLNNLRNQNNENNECRNDVPRYRDFNNLTIEKTYKDLINEFRTNIYNYIHFEKDTIRDFLTINNDDTNEDLRKKYIMNEIDEKHFKKVLHQREKKKNFVKEIQNVSNATYDIFLNYLWLIIVDEPDNINKILLINNMQEIRIETNVTFNKIADDFGYKSIPNIDEKMRFTNLNIRH